MLGVGAGALMASCNLRLRAQVAGGREGVRPQFVANLHFVDARNGRVVGPHVDGLPALEAEGNPQTFCRVSEQREGFVLEHDARVNALTATVKHFTTEPCKLCYMTLGDRIRTERTALGLTQIQLADKVGCKREAVSMWETNKVNRVGGEYLPALCAALGVNAEWLQTGRGPKAPAIEPATPPAALPVELAASRSKNDVRALRYAVQGMLTILHEKQPDVALAVAQEIAALAGVEFSYRGFLNVLLSLLVGVPQMSEDELRVLLHAPASSGSKRVSVRG